MKLKNIHYIDLANHPKAPLPGSFVIELQFTKEKADRAITPEIMAEWCERTFGSPSASTLVPGQNGVYSLTQRKEPALAFVTINYSDPEIIGALATGDYPDHIQQHHDAERRTQAEMKTNLRTDSAAAAITTMLLQRAVRHHAFSEPDARRVLLEQFGIGDFTARGMMRDAAKHQRMDSPVASGGLAQ